MNEKPEVQEDQREEEKFIPKGSIVFFILMIVFFLLIWFAFYAIMVTSRT